METRIVAMEAKATRELVVGSRVEFCWFFSFSKSLIESRIRVETLSEEVPDSRGFGVCIASRKRAMDNSGSGKVKAKKITIQIL
jgi:hypothetical protein